MLTTLASSLVIGAAFGFRPSTVRLRETVEHLSNFPTRNTSSPELVQAAAWVSEQMKQVPGLEVETMSYPIKAGPRIPADKDVVQVIGVLRGETDHRVLVSGHLDSINLKEDVFKGRAPGANDDLSGVALVLESARQLAKYKWHNTLVFCVVSGEEQGLLGSAAIAKRAKAEGWKIDAMLNNDIVGSSKNADGDRDVKHIRLFSPASADTNSRELARLIEFINRSNRVRPMLIFRADRFGRGGDHSSFIKEGFSAVRFTEVYENWDHQHTANDLIQYVDFPYLAGVTQVNLNALASLANAAEAPSKVHVVPKLSLDTDLTWVGAPGVQYQVYWRRTTDAAWRGRFNAGAVEKYTLQKMSKDDLVFAVSAEGGIPVEAR